ncbi:MAG: substrate-binding domain-containing protein [Bacteroidales bacterium]|nr:substrate-binding domain-containing protein [Bacteroidales bacterium]
MKKKLFASLILLLSLTSCFNTKKMWDRYDSNLNYSRVSENDFDVSSYQPFVKGNKVAVLDSASTLLLKKDLPVLDGATALYPLYSAFAQAVYPSNGNKKVRYSNTMNAYKALIDKKVDIIFVASPSAEQLEMAKNAGVELRLLPIAREAFVFFVNSNNIVDNFSIEQLQDIYSGKITNWNEVGGKNDSIIPFQRNIGSGSQTAFLDFMQAKPIITPKKDELIFGMGMMISRVADYINYPNAIGFSFRYFVNEMVGNRQIKLLKINQFPPDFMSIENKKYPLLYDVYAITLFDNKKPNVEKLLNWILSEQGRELIQKTGYCPITR